MEFESWGAQVTAVQTELASSKGVDELYQAIVGRVAWRTRVATSSNW